MKNTEGNNILMNISGIKCDNPNCDYKDLTVPVEDYEKWVDKPCPKCGQNLLTQADYNTVKKMLKTVEVLNKISIPEDKISKSKIVHVRAELNGSGVPIFTIVDSPEE